MKGGIYMKKIRICLAVTSLLLVGIMALDLVSCASQIEARDLMEDVTSNEIDALENIKAPNVAVTEFAVDLFRASMENGENTLISPLSVLCALAMTANGAEEETLSQMEDVLGMSTDELNLYIYTYMKNLPQGESYKLSLANSVWFTEDERLSVKQDFLQTNANYYGADVYMAPFDEGTLKDINNWVKEKTDEMIPKIIDRIPSESVMYLINALAFEAEWMDMYEEDQVRDGEFTKEDREVKHAEFMYGTEDIYFEDSYATGFMKRYKGGKYAFVAMLPNEDVSVAEYVATLDGAKLNSMLAEPQYTTVHTSIPKFETEYDAEMSEILTSMGMSRAFDPVDAEFEGIGSFANGNIYIGRVLHKTFISLGERGTKAGAVTAVEVERLSSADMTGSKEVHLDRPFVYMLVDCENNIPFFIGTMMDVEK